MNASTKELIKEIDKQIGDSKKNLNEAMAHMMEADSKDVSANWARLMREEAKRIAELKSTRKEIIGQNRFTKFAKVFKH